MITDSKGNLVRAELTASKDTSWIFKDKIFYVEEGTKVIYDGNITLKSSGKEQNLLLGEKGSSKKISLDYKTDLSFNPVTGSIQSKVYYIHSNIYPGKSLHVPYSAELFLKDGRLFISNNFVYDMHSSLVEMGGFTYMVRSTKESIELINFINPGKIPSGDSSYFYFSESKVSARVGNSLDTQLGLSVSPINPFIEPDPSDLKRNFLITFDMNPNSKIDIEKNKVSIDTSRGGSIKEDFYSPFGGLQDITYRTDNILIPPTGIEGLQNDKSITGKFKVGYTHLNSRGKIVEDEVSFENLAQHSVGPHMSGSGKTKDKYETPANFLEYSKKIEQKFPEATARDVFLVIFYERYGGAWDRVADPKTGNYVHTNDPIKFSDLADYALYSLDSEKGKNPFEDVPKRFYPENELKISPTDLKNQGFETPTHLNFNDGTSVKFAHIVAGMGGYISGVENAKARGASLNQGAQDGQRMAFALTHGGNLYEIQEKFTAGEKSLIVARVAGITTSSAIKGTAKSLFSFLTFSSGQDKSISQEIQKQVSREFEDYATKLLERSPTDELSNYPASQRLAWQWLKDMQNLSPKEMEKLLDGKFSDFVKYLYEKNNVRL